MKIRHRYRLNLEDESHLSRVVSLPFSWCGLIVVVLIVFGLAVALSVGVIMKTSLKSTLPGYMPPHERQATMSDLMRVDSLQRLYDQNQQYFENLMRVVDDDRPESRAVREEENVVKLSGDSLMPTTQREREFRAMMDERERYNLSVLAPLAADGMEFEEPAAGYTFARGSESDKNARLIIPRGEIIRNITPGTVVSIVYSPSKGYSVMIQHNNGFLSSWSNLGVPVVDEGERLSAGQAIARPDEGNGRVSGYVGLRLWRNGTPLIPYSILRSDRILTPDAVVK